MKYLLALTLAVLLVVVPLAAAEASVITLHVTVVPQDNEGHHFNVKVNATCEITYTDITSFAAFPMEGYFSQQQPSQDYGGAGIYCTAEGIWAYMYIGAGFTPACTAPAFPAFNGRGCLIPVNGLTLNHPQEELIEWDYYPSPYNEWEAFARDAQNNYNFIGKFVTTEDWFTAINLDTTLNYTTPNNPQYPVYSIWNDPQAWVSGPNWVPFSQASVLLYVSNLNDNYVCDDGIYIIARFGLGHVWFGGTGTGINLLKTCSGPLWSS